MRGFLAFFVTVAMTAALIPWPGLFWAWAITMGLVVLLTPLESKPRTRVVKRTRSRG